jgi:hypothetical protein
MRAQHIENGIGTSDALDRSMNETLREQITKEAIKVLKNYYKNECPSCGATYTHSVEHHAEDCQYLRSDALDSLDRKG